MAIKPSRYVPGRLRRSAPKVLDAKTPSDNVLHTNLRPSSESRVRACPGLSMPTSVQETAFAHYELDD